MRHRRERSKSRRAVSNLPLRRKFTLSDSMIVVAAVAAMLMVHRWNNMGSDCLALFQKISERGLWSWKILLEIPFCLAGDATFPMFILTLTTLILRFMSPRPHWGRLTRQPGFVAGMVIMPAWVVACASTFSAVHTISGTAYSSNGVLAKDQLDFWLVILSLSAAEPSGFAVAIAWYVQILMGRWRAQNDWVDRLGRVLGCTWIAMALIRVARSVAMHF